MGNINIEALIEIAGRKLGIPPEELRKSLNSGDISGITSKMSKSDREKVNAVLNDPKLSEKFRKQYTEGVKKD